MIKQQIRVYNTMTGKKEEFQPLQEARVGIYVCGPTTYNFIHLGNARPVIVFDTVRRYLEHIGYKVDYVQNFTDVDDKIIKRSMEEKIAPLELAQKYIAEYFKDAGALDVMEATWHPRVSEHIDEIIKFVKGLEDKGYAYQSDGDVYFEVSRFTGYGKLSKRTLDDLQAGARVEVDDKKRQPADFALWKKAKQGEPSWDSPWGKGRPGWHIECSAMSAKYLGQSFDIHGGGFDLIFPHHENEIAQSEALFEKPMAKYWMHNGFITVNEEKMSKSLGNFFLLREILEKYPSEVVRFYILSTHYRSQLDFDYEKLDAAQKGLERLQTACRLFEEALNKKNNINGAMREKVACFEQESKEIQGRYYDAMNDDFNTALAIGVMFEYAKILNSFAAGEDLDPDGLAVLRVAGEKYKEFANVLGIKLSKEQEMTRPALVDGLLELILQIRQDARKNKDYQTADKIRDELKEMGIVIEDTSQGVRWRFV